MPETRITVTWPDIAAAEPRASLNPVALAAGWSFPGATWIVCGTRTLYLTLGDRRFEYELPAEAEYALGLYYDSGEMSEFSFTLAGPVASYPFRLAPVQQGRWAA
jgi:hypothetical protein